MKKDSEVLVRVADRRDTRAPILWSGLAALALLLVTLLLLAPLQGCGNGGDAADSTAADSSKAGKPKKEKKSSVSAATVIEGNLVLPIIAEGSIVARRSTGIRSEISARIAGLHCQEGQLVRSGQLLISLDDADYRVAVDEARAGYLQALSSLAVELGDEDPGQNFGGEWIADKPLEEQISALRSGEFRREINAARTGLSSARAGEERARLNLRRCEIRAPFAGVITGLTLSPGEWISAGQDLFTLVDNINLEAHVSVLESDLGQLESGRPALLALPALEETLQVKVDIINPILDSASRSCQTILRLKNEGGKIRPGMFVRAAIAGEILPGRMMVPREAVLTRDGRPLVFKVSDGITQWVYVQLGERNDRFYEVVRALQGGSLEPGDQVVVSDHLTLTHGASVKVKHLTKPIVPWNLEKGDER